MRLTWQQRLEQQPSLLNLREWPVIDPLNLPMPKRRQFLRNQKIVAQALQQVPLKAIASQFHLHPSHITHLLNRTLGGEDDRLPPLTQALIPNHRVNSSRRRKALDTLALPAGSANSFNHLLEVVPGLKTYLDKLMRLFVRRHARGQNLRVATFHKAFLRFLRQVQWPADCYPFTVASLGYESVRRYFHRRLVVLSAPKESTRIILPGMKPVSIFEEIQIDEHTVDCHGSIVLVLNNQWEPLRLSRITLIAARDVASSCVLAVLLVLSRSPTKEDLLTLFQLMTQPWQSAPLATPGFTYPPGIAMPTALGNDFLRPALGIIRFDNAMVHRAVAVRDYVCDVIGATFNLGIPKYPLARVLIESAFKDLNLTVHRFPSTTGSNPVDPVKEPAHLARKAPLISLKALEDTIHVHVAHMNQKALGNLGAVSPINVMQAQMANHWIPLRPECCLQHNNPMIGRDQVKVHYSVSEHRRPWINYAYLRYDAPHVLTPDMKGKTIWIEFNRNDVRELTAISDTGEHLGMLQAPAPWRRFPHSLTTRKFIQELIKAGHVKAEDPFGSYFDYLLAHRALPTEALELVRVSREFGAYSQPEPPEKKTAMTSSQRSQVAPRKSKAATSSIPDWSTDMIDRRRG